MTAAKPRKGESYWDYVNRTATARQMTPQHLRGEGQPREDVR